MSIHGKSNHLHRKELKIVSEHLSKEKTEFQPVVNLDSLSTTYPDFKLTEAITITVGDTQPEVGYKQFMRLLGNGDEAHKPTFENIKIMRGSYFDTGDDVLNCCCFWHDGVDTWVGITQEGDGTVQVSTGGGSTDNGGDNTDNTDNTNNTPSEVEASIVDQVGVTAEGSTLKGTKASWASYATVSPFLEDGKAFETVFNSTAAAITSMIGIHSSSDNIPWTDWDYKVWVVKGVLRYKKLNDAGGTPTGITLPAFSEFKIQNIILRW